MGKRCGLRYFLMKQIQIFIKQAFEKNFWVNIKLGGWRERLYQFHKAICNIKEHITTL